MKQLFLSFLLLLVPFSNTIIKAQSGFQSSNNGLPTICNILDFAYSNDSTLYTIVSVVGDKAYIYKSKDNGDNWSVVNQSGLPTWFNSIEYANNTLFVGTWELDSIVYKSADGGLNWNPSNKGIPSICNLLDFTVKNGIIYAIVSIIGDKAYIYKSSDNGANWSVVNQTGLPTWFNSLGSTNNDLLVGTWEEGSLIYKSTDNGISWSSSNTGIPSVCNILSFTKIKNDIFTLVSIVGDKAYIYKSADNGSSWSVVNQTVLPTWFNCLGSTYNALFVGTWEEGDIMYKNEFPSTSNLDIEKQNQNFIFPNPANNFIYFNQSLKVELFSINGSLLISKTDTNELDLTSLKPGIYYLISENFNVKIIKF